MNVKLSLYQGVLIPLLSVYMLANKREMYEFELDEAG